MFKKKLQKYIYIQCCFTHANKQNFVVLINWNDTDKIKILWRQIYSLGLVEKLIKSGRPRSANKEIIMAKSRQKKVIQSIFHQYGPRSHGASLPNVAASITKSHFGAGAPLPSSRGLYLQLNIATL